MYLQSLKFAGFKSFADRTRLQFRPGVTVVVGPNGSGKSNLVDALSWVLGTQSTKSLRTDKMEDVIFAGTTTRPALGRAEVTLVIDNADRRLDIDLDEISITRRLYRDGSSDYELNGVACRLLDIQDLLSDSGVGKHQHVIIGQGEIGRILSASPDDNRSVIEEAAGILKHRRRKERAERRLERTDEDMVRLQDLLGEIERQMRPLRRQARAAERYQGLKDEVAALRLYLGGRDLARHDREITIATSERSQLLEKVHVDQRAVEDLAQRLRALGDETSRVGDELDRDTTAAASLETTMERLRRVASVAHERARAVNGRVEVAVERRADLEEERHSILTELDAIGTEATEAASSAEAAERRLRGLEDEERALTTQNALSPEGALAAVRGELSALESSLERDGREEAQILHRLEVLAGRRNEEQAEVERINEEIKALDEQITAYQQAYASARKQRERDQSTWSEAEEALRRARLTVAVAESRVEAVREALAGRFDSEARRIAEDAEGALGTLISQLDVPDGLEAAVEAALGRWADAVAFTDQEAVRDVVGTVKAAGGGAVPVVSAISESSVPAREVADALGVEALVDLLGEQAHAGLTSRLLGDVVVVEGWVTGWEIVARHPALRAVTPEGDLISVTGVHIADPEGAGLAMLESAELALESACTQLARAESIHTAARRGFETSRQAERDALESLEAAEAELAGRSEAMRRIEQSIASQEEEAERLVLRRQALREAIAAATGQIQVLRSRIESLKGEEAARMKVWEELEARRQQVAAQREKARWEWQEAAGRLRAVTERKNLLEERVRRIDAELERLTHDPGPSGDPAALSRVARFATRGVAVLRARIGELRERQSRLRDRHKAHLADLETLRQEHEERRAAIATAQARVSELEVRLAELRLRREAVVETIRRDADAGEEEALVASRPEVAEGTDLEELLEAKLAQLRRLGPINPLAAREFAALEERHVFLSEQMADVQSSRDELRKVISALDEEIQKRFREAFDDVAEAYQRYFAILFPGGRGRVRLTDPEDPQSGVLIEAQPLGKKLSRMTLLSGGERSLAALAFLFAIFEARPSPFYVLDEVEAALDDVNLRRFLRIVDEFRDKAQLIIVTHQQQTMEVADVLYGVTMEPGGSSQVVSKLMTEISSDQVA
ncbi:MAG: chromosome segregation protein SMC [Acidimicrobiia bacterium]